MQTSRNPDTSWQSVYVPAFNPPKWMRNPHFQTILSARLPRRFRTGWTSWEPLEISLGNEGALLAEVSWQPGKKEGSPALILIHGLEGSARSPYMLGISKKAYARGFHSVRLNMRTCGGTEHMTPTLYCAGLSQDVHHTIVHLQGHFGIKDIYALGISLGGNVLLKFLGERADAGSGTLRAAAAMSPPIDLASGAKKLRERSNWIYERHFVAGLIKRMRRKAELFPGIADMKRVERIRSVYEFDDVVTAPHFGYGRAEDYYRLASSAPLLGRIRVPTLIVQAKDDPMIPFEPFERSGIEQNPYLRLLATRYGGHAGFLATRRTLPSDPDRYWAESRIVDFLSYFATASKAG